MNNRPNLQATSSTGHFHLKMLLSSSANVHLPGISLKGTPDLWSSPSGTAGQLLICILKTVGETLTPGSGYFRLSWEESFLAQDSSLQTLGLDPR